MVHQSALHGQVADEQVLGHIQLGRDGQLLVNAGHARRNGLLGRFEVDFLAVDQILTSVPGMGAGHDLDQRRFSRAVLSAQRVDLALTDIERDAVQRLYAGENLFNAFEFNKGLSCTQSLFPLLCFGPAILSPMARPISIWQFI